MEGGRVEEMKGRGEGGRGEGKRLKGKGERDRQSGRMKISDEGNK